MSATFSFSLTFSNLPAEILNNLEKTYIQIIRNYHENRFEPSELNGAKFSETIFRLLEWYTNENKLYTKFGQEIHNFSDSVRKFENLSKFPDSIRFHIPRMISSIYSLRNKRGVGHIGGDVNPNYMDSTIIVNISKWVLAEIVRIFHSVSLSEAQNIVENLVTKDYPIIWNVFDKKRVLDSNLDHEKKTLTLLYSSYPNFINEQDLVNWIEYSNPTMYRKKVLFRLHKLRMLEYDSKSKQIIISPKGIKFVEENIKLKI